MRKYLLPALIGIVMGGAGLASLPASAAVSGPSHGIQPTSTIEHVRMMRRHRMMRHHGMMRSRRMMRSRMGSDINAANPSRPGYMQRKGNTSGGPRY